MYNNFDMTNWYSNPETFTSGGILPGLSLPKSSGPSLNMSKTYEGGLTGRGKDGMTPKQQNLAGAGMSTASGLIPSSGPLGTLAKTGLSAGSGALTGGPVGAGVAGGATLVSSLMGGKGGQQKPQIAVPTTAPTMGKIGDIYG